MNFDEYQQKALSTWLKPGGENKTLNLAYLALGVSGEGGEVAEKIKKVIRNSGGDLSTEKKLALKDEIGDVLWYLAVLSLELGFTLDSVAERNLEKLQQRKEQNLLKSEGDNRHSLYLLFDGGIRSETGRGYGSWLIKSHKNSKEMGELRRSEYDRKMTNNEAEYETLIHALGHILLLGYNPGDISLHIEGDSDLVRKQIGTRVDITPMSSGKISSITGKPTRNIYTWNDDFRVNHKHLEMLRDNCRTLLEAYKSVQYDHIDNKEVKKILGH